MISTAVRWESRRVRSRTSWLYYTGAKTESPVICGANKCSKTGEKGEIEGKQMKPTWQETCPLGLRAVDDAIIRDAEWLVFMSHN